MNEESNDITIINPSGREVIVPNYLGQELLLQPGYRIKPAAEAVTEVKVKQVAPAAVVVPEAIEETPKSRGSASK